MMNKYPTVEDVAIYTNLLDLTLQINSIEVKFIVIVPREKMYIDVKTNKILSRGVMEVLLNNIQIPLLYASIKKFEERKYSYYITLLLEK